MTNELAENIPSSCGNHAPLARILLLYRAGPTMMWAVRNLISELIMITSDIKTKAERKNEGRHG